MLRKRIFYNAETKIGTIKNAKGNIWSTLGTFKNQKTTVFLDESIFLCDQYGYELISADEELTLTSLANLLSFDTGIASYQVRL